jgi:hypothetical protein
MFASVLIVATLGLRGWAASRARAASRVVATSDDAADVASSLSWRASSATSTRLLFAARSSLDPALEVRVAQRGAEWRTMSLVGRGREVMHGIARLTPDGLIDPTAVPLEYVKSLASLGLAGMQLASEVREVPDVSRSCDEADGPRCLFLGLGPATLPALIGAYLPSSHLVAVELDTAVCDAARLHLGANASAVRVVADDAVEWVRREAAEADSAAFDAVFIDVFDEANVCPVELRSEPFLSHLGALLTPHAGATNPNPSPESCFSRISERCSRRMQVRLAPRPDPQPRPESAPSRHASA